MAYAFHSFVFIYSATKYHNSKNFKAEYTFAQYVLFNCSFFQVSNNKKSLFLYEIKTLLNSFAFGRVIVTKVTKAILNITNKSLSRHNFESSQVKKGFCFQSFLKYAFGNQSWIGCVIMKTKVSHFQQFASLS